MTRHLAAAGAASLIAFVLAERVYSDFAPVRVKVLVGAVEVQTGQAVVPLAPEASDGAIVPPAALIWRVAHAQSEAANFAVELDGHHVCERLVEPGNARLDCVIRADAWGSAPEKTLVIRGPAGPWRLEYVEVASHHGNTTGALRVFVIPAVASVAAPHLVWVALAWICSVALLVSAPVPNRRSVRLAHRGASVLVLVLFAVIAVAPWLTPFRVVLAPVSWVVLALVLTMPGLIKVSRRVWQASPRLRTPGLAHAVTVVLVAIAAARVVHLEVGESLGGNYSGLVHISEERFDAHPVLGSRADIRATLLLVPDTGYDAQFMYFAAFDPLARGLRDPAGYRAFIDAPPYRYARIGFVWLTKAASLDRWDRYAAAMVWLIAGGIVATAAGLAALARHCGATPWWGLIVLAMPGMWRSLHMALPEPIAAACVVAAFLCLARERWRWAALWFASALLVRETTAIALIVAAGYLWWRGQRRAGMTLIAAFVPCALWRAYVGWRMFPDWGFEGFYFNPGTLGVPGVGMARMLVNVSAGTYFPGTEVASASLWFAALLIAAVALSFAFCRRRVTAVTITGAAYAAMALCFDRELVWTHVVNVERTTYELFLMMAVATVMSGLRTRRLMVMLAAFWTASALYVLYLGLDTLLMQRALLPI